MDKICHAQNEALRIITGSHKMSSIDQLHSEIGDDTGQGPHEPFLCGISGTLSRHGEHLSPHQHDGSSTEGHERDTLHQT